MSYCRFLAALFEDGRVTVPQLAPLTDEELMSGDRLIAHYEQMSRLNMPGDPPDHVSAASRWAAVRFFRAGQLTVFRNLGEAVVTEELGAALEERVTADVHYSVDLVFRFLPDLIRFASSAAENDPLVDYLRRWASEWPLSSVGVAGIDADNVSAFADNKSLIQLYADRIISTGDTTRLTDNTTRNVVRCSVGRFPDLSPRITDGLSKYNEQDQFQ